MTRHRETLTIWPYRSLPPRGFALVMIALGVLAFCIGLGFFLMGAWPVIGFLGLELLVVWVAFKMNYRAARRRQHLTATSRQLTIEDVSPAGDSRTMGAGQASCVLKPARRPGVSVARVIVNRVGDKN